MPKLYSVDALVIKARDYGEADKILSLYTREQGKIQAISKGVRKPASRLRGGVQLFSHSRLLLYRGRTLDTVTQAETREAFAGLRDDLARLAYASYLVELLDHAVPEREPNERLFVLTLVCLGLLLGEDPELVMRLYEIRLLALLGYRPFLAGCIVCRQPLGLGDYYLQPGQGGLVCRKCRGEGPGKGRVSPGTVQVFSRLLAADPRQIFRLKVPAAMREEMDAALGYYLEYYLERTIKAKKVLDSILKKPRKES